MNTEEYLNGLRGKMRKLKVLKAEIEALEYAASGQGAIRYDKERVQSSATNKMEKFAIEATEKREAFAQMVQQYDDEKFEAYQIIKRIESNDERVVLEWYYINASSESKVIEKLSVSRRTYYKIKKRAVESFGRLKDELG